MLQIAMTAMVGVSSIANILAHSAWSPRMSIGLGLGERFARGRQMKTLEQAATQRATRLAGPAKLYEEGRHE